MPITFPSSCLLSPILQTGAPFNSLALVSTHPSGLTTVPRATTLPSQRIFTVLCLAFDTGSRNEARNLLLDFEGTSLRVSCPCAGAVASKPKHTKTMHKFRAAEQVRGELRVIC